MLEEDNIFDILASEEDRLPPLPPALPENGSNGAPAGRAADDADWLKDSVPVKLEKIKAVFLNAKTPADVENAAATMPVADWLDLASKFGKQTETGPIKITAIRIELPPAETCLEANVIDVELPQ